MRKEFRHFGTIFSFTFHQHTAGGGFRGLTAVLALICLFLPILIFTIAANAEQEEQANPEVETTAIEQLLVVDELEGESLADSGLLEGLLAGEQRYRGVSCSYFSDMQKAIKAVKNSHTLLLRLTEDEESAQVTAVLPEDSELTTEEAENMASWISAYADQIWFGKLGLTEEVWQQLGAVVQSEVVTEELLQEEEESPLDQIQQIFSMLLPYLTIMILYFMVLFYGQGVANSVIMEKNTKLVDTFLVSVRPSAMILGKILAMAVCGLLQLGIWIAAAAVGCVIGCRIAEGISPQMPLLLFFRSFGMLSSGLFTPGGIVLALLLLVSGFFLYCGLAAIGGAIAGKPEDLSSTNLLFTMAIVISFLFTLSSGVMEGTLSSANPQVYIPFTSVLIAPSMALLGQISWMEGVAALLISLLSTLLIIWLAGRIYQMLLFYKGNPPSLKQVFQMVKESRGSNAEKNA